MAGKLHSLREAAHAAGTYLDKLKLYAAKAGVVPEPAGNAFVIDDDDLAKIKAFMKAEAKLKKKAKTR